MMAEAAKSPPKRFGRGIRKAALRPGQAKDGQLGQAMQFAPAPDDTDTEQDFDAILHAAMNAKDVPASQLSQEETENTAALALRLAEKVRRARSEKERPALAEARAAIAARHTEEEDDEDLAEPADLQRLIAARETMAKVPPLRPAAELPEEPVGTVNTPAAPAPKKAFIAEEEPRPNLAAFADLEDDEEEIAALKGFPADDEESSEDHKLSDPATAELQDDPASAFAKLIEEGAFERPNTDTPKTERKSRKKKRRGGRGPAKGTMSTIDLDESAGQPVSPLGGIIERLTPAAIWLSLAMVVGSLVYGAWVGGVDVIVASLFGGGLLTFGTILIVAGAVKSYSPLLLTGFLFRRARYSQADAAVLAGNDILQSLGLAEGIIDADADARLVTTRDGVVVYANDAYLNIAAEAGVRGATGLPPRIDRLFGQSGTESSKMFRLAKACRSGHAAEEVLTQAMGRANPGQKGELPLRRFAVHVRPMRPAGDGQIYAAWRLHELEVDRQQDVLKSAYFNYPRPVVALERSGAFAWMNRAAADLFGTKPGQALALGDVVLGEIKPILHHLWESEAEEHEARIRDRADAASGASRDVILTPFSRGGPGEGFVCIEIADKNRGAAESPAGSAGSDLTDAPFGVAVLEGDLAPDAKVTYANNLFQESFAGVSEGVRLGQVLSSTAIEDLNTALKAKSPQRPLTKPVEVAVGDGQAAHIFRIFARPVRRRRGAYGPRQTVIYAVDITYQRRMEEESTQAQKLQQIGQIAGSVAHDFNNLLVVVMGSTELLMRNHPVGDPSYRDLSMIYETAQRAQNLTRNLLAFSRKQTLKPEVCSVTELLNDFTPALKRYVSEKVALDVVHGRNVPEIKADKQQIHLAIMNLAVNARDAMPNGGSLKIETRHVLADDIRDFGYEVLEEVDHVLIEVADTGGGVPSEHADHIFEPFYTTKGEGQGTGLGLSTVAGAIAQMGGRIFLHNRLGEGATFRIFLPAVTEEEAAAAAARRSAAVRVEESSDPTGKGRILVVEDEDGVRSIVVRALGMCGYDIVEASDGEEALEMIQEDDERFDLVLTDIMMPQIDGPTLIQEAGDKLRGAKVVFMSGYAEATMREKLNTIEGARYLQKPFTLTSVAAVVKEALAGH
ncbi:MAG: ATP-binding protein [Parvularcula sp.]|jgi:two-component system cell cycle sensor histidine kinase/response regulator CckA|nr:ATP-binding protein [Parvularcula sp.]